MRGLNLIFRPLYKYFKKKISKPSSDSCGLFINRLIKITQHVHMPFMMSLQHSSRNKRNCPKKQEINEFD